MMAMTKQKHDAEPSAGGVAPEQSQDLLLPLQAAWEAVFTVLVTLGKARTIKGARVQAESLNTALKRVFGELLILLKAFDDAYDQSLTTPGQDGDVLVNWWGLSQFFQGQTTYMGAYDIMGVYSWFEDRGMVDLPGYLNRTIMDIQGYELINNWQLIQNELAIGRVSRLPEVRRIASNLQQVADRFLCELKELPDSDRRLPQSPAPAVDMPVLRTPAARDAHEKDCRLRRVADAGFQDLVDMFIGPESSVF